MRFFVVALLAAVACTFASSASAMNYPPIGLGSLRIVKLSHHNKNTTACAAKLHSRSAAAKRARKMSPVACEQPPRSKVLDAGFVIVLAP